VTAEPFHVRAAGAVLHGTRWAGGTPAVVLLHAGVCDRRSWGEVAGRLSPGHTVIAYDRRGFGETAPASGPFSHVADLFAVLDAAGVGPAWLAGSSAGGRVALDAALLEPDRVAGLVLFSPSVSGAPEPAQHDAATERLGELAEAAAAAGDLDEVNRLETWIWLDGPAAPQGRVSGPARDLALAMNAIVLRNSDPESAGGSPVDAWSQLEKVTMPVTVACGDLDLPYLAGRCEQLATRLPAGQHRVLPGTAHLPNLEQPGLAASVITEAIAVQGGAAA
jgi:pimeloyl-ACP methyl ester carboxylesterase